MKKKVLAAALAATVLATSLVGCGSKGGDDEIVIGSILPLSGAISSFGQSAKNAAELFKEEVNAAGGIDGKKVVIKYEDDEGDPTKANNAYNKLVKKENVQMVAGPLTSGCTNAIGSTATDDEIPLITIGGTQTELTKNGGKYVFRACYIDATQGQVIAKYANEELKAKTMAILYNVSSDYSKGIAETIKKDFEAAGGKVVQYDSYNKGDKDFSAQLTNTKAANADVVALPDYYDVVSLIAKQARQTGIESAFIGGDGWDSPDLIKLAGKSIDGGYFVNHYSPEDTDPAVQDFVQKYKDKYGQTPDALAALSYTTLQLYKAAIEKAKSTDGPAIMKALTEIDTTTITGKIKFDKNRNPVKSLSIIQIENGTQKLVNKVDAE